MKNLFSFSDSFNYKFIFRENSPEINESFPTKKELYETARISSWENFKKEHKENREKALKEARKNKETPDFILNIIESDIPDEIEYLNYQNNTSLISPKNGDSWENIVKESNYINSAKLTAGNNTTFTRENNIKIWNLLQTKGNIKKVSNYLEGLYGTLKMDDKVGIWFNEETQKTTIYFQRNDDVTEVSFSKI